MNAHTHAGSLWSRLVFNAAVVGIGLLGCWQAAHAATAANTDITNTATVSYTDGNGLPQTDQSNTVSTIVQAVDSVTIEAPTTKIIGPDGGTLAFLHTVTNTGNRADDFNLSDENHTGGATINTFVYYIDDGDGIFQPGGADGAPVTATGSIAPDANKKIWVQVTVVDGDAGNPGGNAAGDSTFDVKVTGAAHAATDTVTDTVTTAKLGFSKKQALDAACDGTADVAFAETQITTGAIPGACIRYEITLTNGTGQAVTAAAISDTTPTYTKLDCTGSSDPDATTGTVSTTIAAEPACGNNGTITTTAADIPVVGTIILTFGVKID
jgi:hypothetical protein